MNAKILNHLKERPLAPIVNASKEIGDINALKLMCIIDHILEINGFYSAFEAMPKLMNQLLSFHSYGAFKFFKYTLPKFVFDHKSLKCKNCELIGPYKTVVQHMVINHNIHIRSDMCMWCEKVDLQTHKSESSLDVCYQMYWLKFSSKKFPSEVTKFYELLEDLAKSLKVIVNRNNFKNLHLSKTHEQLKGIESNELSIDVCIYTPKKQSKKVFDAKALEGHFIKAMVHFYDADAYQRFTFRDVDSSAAQSPTNSNRNRKRRSSATNIPANESTESTPSTPNTDPKKVKPDPDSSPFFNTMATVVNDIQDERLKDVVKKEIRKIVIKYAGQDIDSQPQ